MHTPAARALALRTSGVTYPSGIEHVRAVRADLHALLRDCPRADDVILCASELAANAVLHSHSRWPGGTFTVRATVSPGSYVRIEVEDNGHGIPAEVRDKIFEPFFTTKEVGKGTGLGLSMVYGIVKQTGGYVFCVSEPGQGATFRILLPRHTQELTVEPQKKIEVKPAADLTGRGAILLVEDEEAVRAFASRALASRGYTVMEAESGVDALRVYEEVAGKIDLIVSDVIMPEMDGPTMLMELRHRGLAAKIIFVSGYADDAFARSLPEGQEFQFLQKPFTLKQLIETVKGAMS